MTARRGFLALLTMLAALLLAATAVFAASAYGNRPPEMGIHYKRVQLQNRRPSVTVGSMRKTVGIR